jgi:putative membrane protein insertion efficiency factor
MKQFVISLLYLYRWLISPFLPPSCRFTPTCSRYAISAIECHGVIKGLWMTLKRVCRCNPFNKADSPYDPVPPSQISPQISFSDPIQAKSLLPNSIYPANSSRSHPNGSQKLKRAHHA